MKSLNIPIEKASLKRLQALLKEQKEKAEMLEYQLADTDNYILQIRKLIRDKRI